MRVLGSKAMEHGVGQGDFITMGTPSQQMGFSSLARTPGHGASVEVGMALGSLGKARAHAQ